MSRSALNKLGGTVPTVVLTLKVLTSPSLSDWELKFFVFSIYEHLLFKSTIFFNLIKLICHLQLYGLTNIQFFIVQKIIQGAICNIYFQTSS